MAVPKKVLRRAVDRNAVKRVFREAWRAQQHLFSSMEGHDKASEVRLHPGTIAQTGNATSVHLRLLGKPAAFAGWSRPQRKRAWRGELDTLLARSLP